MRLLRALVEARDGVGRADEAQVRSYGLTEREFDCLVTVGVDQPVRMCDLAERSLVTRSHATQIVKELEARELARRQRSPENDREVLVSLTPDGEALFCRVYPQQYEFLKGLFNSRLSEPEQEALIVLLRKLAGDA